MSHVIRFRVLPPEGRWRASLEIAAVNLPTIGWYDVNVTPFFVKDVEFYPHGCWFTPPRYNDGSGEDPEPDVIGYHATYEEAKAKANQIDVGEFTDEMRDMVEWCANRWGSAGPEADWDFDASGQFRFAHESLAVEFRLQWG